MRRPASVRSPLPRTRAVMSGREVSCVTRAATSTSSPKPLAWKSGTSMYDLSGCRPSKTKRPERPTWRMVYFSLSLNVYPTLPSLTRQSTSIDGR